MSDAQPRILVVDDEENIRFLVTTALNLSGLETVTAASGFEALDQIYRERPDLIVLDVMLPDMDGFAILRRLRDQGNQTPIIFLTARDQSADRVKGLSEGGDDYIVKPFDFRELLVRMRMLLKRNPAAVSGAETGEILRVADLELNTGFKTAMRNGQPITLTAREYSLLEYLVRRNGRVASRHEIVEHVWDVNFDTGTNVVEVYINFLRKKIDKNFQPKLIHTKQGMGYYLKELPV